MTIRVTQGQTIREFESVEEAQDYIQSLRIESTEKNRRFFDIQTDKLLGVESWQLKPEFEVIVDHISQAN